MDDLASIVTLAKGGNAISLQHQAARPLPLASTAVLVRFIASTINPLDHAVIAGAYPVKPKYADDAGRPILGFDGVGIVLSIGPDVTDLSVGDFVVPSKYGIGTWRSRGVFHEQDLDRIPPPEDRLAGSILRLGVAPAYFLVEDFRDLKPGETIIQNAGNSFIAQMVAQFAKRKGVNVISVVQGRNGHSYPKDMARRLGVSAVVTESDVDSLPQNCIMAIDSVGGASGQRLMGRLRAGGTFVQHGFLAGKKSALVIEQTKFWAKQLTLVASRSSAQMATRTDEERKSLLGWFVELFNAGELKRPQLATIEVRVGSQNHPHESQSIEEAVAKTSQGQWGQNKHVILWKELVDSFFLPEKPATRV